MARAVEQQRHIVSSGPAKVAYFCDQDAGSYSFPKQHPMNAARVALTHDLVFSYGLAEHLQLLRADHASPDALKRFHQPEYVETFLQGTPDTRFNIGPGTEQPIFPGVSRFVTQMAGASIAAASIVNDGNATIAINWGGGMHHAKRDRAHGFCYMNDCVLAIMELLKFHTRVLYIDIDLHHGDGVEEAFYHSGRVMTLSLHHSSKNFFPGTGDVPEHYMGAGEGRGCSVNIPLHAGASDAAYQQVFGPVLERVVAVFQPAAVVMQCGADCVTGDALGAVVQSNLSSTGHGACIQAVKALNLPLVVLGGGGYTPANVARCWAYDTGILCGAPLPDDLPEAIATARKKLFKGMGLHIQSNKQWKDTNTQAYLHSLVQKAVGILREARPAM